MRLVIGMVIGLALGSAGLSVGGGRPPAYAPSTVTFDGGGAVKATFDAPQTGTVVFARWVTIAPGVGGGSFVAELEVNGAVVCSLTVGCADAAGTEVSTSCGAAFAAGDDVDWSADGAACGVEPSGSVTYITQN
jgi:hypothetical protein